MNLGKKVVPPPPPPKPEWVPCGKEREINTRTGMKRTVIEKNREADPPYGWPNYAFPLPGVDEDNT
jgi:hypothetical protein